MSPYIIVLGLLCLGAFDEGFVRRRSSNRVYSFLFLILTLMLCLRYGQGTDYLGYKQNYVTMPVFKSLRAMLKSSIHGEPGWKLLCMVCHNFLKLPFEWFIGFISAFEMYCLNRFIRSFCSRRVLALLIFYPTFYLTYYFSAIRQGLVLAVFLGFLLEYCLKKQYVKYFIGVALLSLIHSAALILIIIPTIYYLRIGLKNSMIVVLFCFVCGSVIGFTGLKSLLPYATADISWLAIAERMVSFIVVLFACVPVYNKLIRENSRHTVIRILRIYILGMMIYGLCFSSDLLASRIMIFFKCMELILFGFTASYKPKKGEATAVKGFHMTMSNYQMIYIFSILLAGVMTLKNLGAYISQMKYFSSVTIWNFPYVSVFNPERIAEYSNFWSVEYFY